MKGCRWLGTTFGVILFAIFDKSQTIDAKKDAQSHAFSSGSEPWAHQGRLRVNFGRFLKLRKIADFSMSFRSSTKSEKSILGASQGRPGDIDARIRGIRGPRAAANYQRNRCIDDKNHEVRVLTRRWAVGPANCLLITGFEVQASTRPDPTRGVGRFQTIWLAGTAVLKRVWLSERSGNLGSLRFLPSARSLEL